MKKKNNVDKLNDGDTVSCKLCFSLEANKEAKEIQAEIWDNLSSYPKINVYFDEGFVTSNQELSDAQMKLIEDGKCPSSTEFFYLVEYENEEEFTEVWENLSEEDAQELKKLEIQSEKEYEQWLKQQKLQEKRKQQEENLRKKMKEDEEKQKTQELLEQMMKAENERRQKLLEDVQNSLQGNDSTNVSSGADDIIDLDYEGELD